MFRRGLKEGKISREGEIQELYRGLGHDVLLAEIGLHCKKIPVKLTVKLPPAVLPTKNRKMYGNDNDNRYFFTGKNP